MLPNETKVTRAKKDHQITERPYRAFICWRQILINNTTTVNWGCCNGIPVTAPHPKNMNDKNITVGTPAQKKYVSEVFGKGVIVVYPRVNPHLDPMPYYDK